MPDFKLQQNFPIATVIDASQRKAQLAQQNQLAQQQMTNDAIKNLGQVGQSLFDMKQKVARSLAQAKILSDMNPGLMRPFDAQVSNDEGLPMNLSQTPEGHDKIIKQVATALGDIPSNEFLRAALPPMVQQNVYSADALGNITGSLSRNVPKGSSSTVVKPTSPGNATKPQQSQYSDEAGNPLIFDPVAGGYKAATLPPGVKPILKKGDESAIADATLLSNQLPNIQTMFDAYRNSTQPRLQSTQAGRLMNPSGKQAEDSLKLAAFSFGGKNLTGQEKAVVFGALFPSWTDNEESRDAKEALLTNFMSGKINLLEAANLLGPAGAPMRQMLEKKMDRKGSDKTKTQTKSKASASPENYSEMSEAELKAILRE